MCQLLGSFFYQLRPHKSPRNPVEECQRYSPSLGLVPDDQAHSPLRAVHCCCDYQRSQHVVSQTYTKISLVGDIGLHQYHQVKAANLYYPYDLRKPISLAVEGPKG